MMDYFDLHCDTICELSRYRLYRQETGTLLQNSGQLDLTRAMRCTHYAQVFALFCGAQPLNDARQAHERLMHLLETAQRAFSESASVLRHCRTGGDLRQAEREGKAAAFLAIEGAELLQSEDDIRTAAEAGVRLVTLTWNHRSRYGCGAAADNEAGLTEEGIRLVKILSENGMFADVSHLSEHGFWDLASCTDAPIVATHSNSRAVCPHLRNLTDAQFEEIIARGGVAGINLYVPFLTRRSRADCTDVVRHIEHFCSLGGQHHVCIGADWDGCDRFPDGITDVTGIEAVAEALARHGYTDTQIHNFLYDNARRFVIEQF
ncbi:MAG TPA: membrane dipeptidase [Clostridiales bacterium]|nr:membrane dipeptidase [Clostridiales bacterium]